MSSQMELPTVAKLSLQPRQKCPLEDVNNLNPFDSENECPYHKTRHVLTTPDGKVGKFIKVDKLNVVAGSFESNQASEALLKKIGGGDRVRQMVTRFYAHAFKDATISKFIFAGDGAAAHGDRLGGWLVEKWGGEGQPWADAGRTGQRGPSHAKAWNSAKRARSDRGVRFKQDDCRIWMRLMFLAGREVGLDRFADFWQFFQLFIRHFIGVYERTAQKFVRESMEWSEDPANYEKYKQDGYLMKEVAGIGRR